MFLIRPSVVPMDQVMALLLTGMILASVGLFLTTLGVFMATGELPQNRLVGITVSSVTKSERHWSIGHRAAAPANLATGVVVQVLGGLVAVRPQYDLLTVALVAAAWTIVGVGAATAWRLAVGAAHQLD